MMYVSYTYIYTIFIDSFENISYIWRKLYCMTYVRKIDLHRYFLHLFHSWKNTTTYYSGIICVKIFGLLSKNQRSSNQLDCVFCGAKRKPPSLLKLIANETKLEKLSLPRRFWVIRQMSPKWVLENFLPLLLFCVLNKKGSVCMQQVFLVGI